MLNAKEKAKWVKVVRAYEASGYKGSIASWCKQESLHYDRFLYWKGRLETSKEEAISRSSFTEVAIDSTDSKDSGVSIDCHGLSIQLARGFDPTVLQECLIAIQKLKC